MTNKSTTSGPDPIDKRVGFNIRELRTAKSMTQAQLGRLIDGLSFQQIQKYEKGTNRVSASKLWKISQALDVPITSFFDGVEQEAKGLWISGNAFKRAAELQKLCDIYPETGQAILRLVSTMTRSLIK